VLGSGQLGRMLAFAARRMGYRVHTLSPETDTPTGQVADREIGAPYEDLDAVRAFALGVDVVTFEFENVPAATAEAAAELAPVHPSPAVLRTMQHRLREKTYLAGAGFPVAPFRHVRTPADLQDGLRDLGLPAILKRAGFGYDGKGQVRVARPDDAVPALAALGGQEGVLEAQIDFACEVSVVAARTAAGEFAHYGAISNTHEGGILDLSAAPAALDPQVARRAVELTADLAHMLAYVGVLCVEYFVTRDGALLVNEVAPRPHNSGHLTIEACPTGQFEQQLRAVCALPLGATTPLHPAGMANLLGDLWQSGEPNWAAACAMPSVMLHLYGKRDPRPGRKMGHLTALGADAAEARACAARARDALRYPPGAG
jgi:5-(carboxyamino)imidazole ribonucleotide synthase